MAGKGASSAPSVEGPSRRPKVFALGITRCAEAPSQVVAVALCMYYWSDDSPISTTTRQEGVKMGGRTNQYP